MSSNQQLMTTEQQLSELNKRVGQLVARGKSIAVKDQSTCLAEKEFEVQVKSYEKAVEQYADGDIQMAKEHLANLQAAKKMLLAPVLEILESCKRSRKQWEENERRAAEAEQRRINEENRRLAAEKAEEERQERERQAFAERRQQELEADKLRKAGEISKREADKLKKEAVAQEERQRQQAADDAKLQAQVAPVEVKASIPTLQGTQSRRNWKFKVTHKSIIPRQYTMPDMVAIGQMVRDEKDKDKAEALCPGIEVWSE